MAFTLAKQHSDAEASHRALTESSASEKLGTHLTSLSVKSTLLPVLSDAVIGRYTDEGTTLGATVNAHNAILILPHVYEIRCMRIDMPCASAIYNEIDAATSIAQVSAASRRIPAC
eukprot:3032084-Pleurochrysis_carterae.AAC.2